MTKVVEKLRDEIIREKSLEYVELYNKCVDDEDCNESEIACMRMVIAEEIAITIYPYIQCIDLSNDISLCILTLPLIVPSKPIIHHPIPYHDQLPPFQQSSP